MMLPFLAAAAIGMAAPGDGPYSGQVVVRAVVDSPRQFLALMALEPDVLTHTPRMGEAIEVRLSAAQLDAVRQLGLRVEVTIPDVQAHVEAMFAEIAQVNAGDGSFYENYRNPDELRARMDGVAAGAPAMVTPVLIGTSLEGRQIYGLSISAPDRLGNPRNQRPQALINGTQHAREWVATMATAYFAEHLAARYGSDPVVRDAVNRVETIVVPIVNPDGYAYTWGPQRFWRKNMRRNASGTLHGVDLNRNWGYQWGGEGSSGNPNNETYRGTAAFSEPESQALRDFILGNPRLAAHCDVHTSGNMVMSPWGYTATLPPDHAYFAAANEVIAGAIRAVNGLDFRRGPIYTTIYPASGVFVDWAYGDRGMGSWTFELRGGGFAPPATEIMPACTETFAGLLEVVRTALRPVCTADANLDGVVDFNDLLIFTDLLRAGNALADVDDDGTVDFNDFLVYLNLYNAGC